MNQTRDSTNWISDLTDLSLGMRAVEASDESVLRSISARKLGIQREESSDCERRAATDSWAAEHDVNQRCLNRFSAVFLLMVIWRLTDDASSTSTSPWAMALSLCDGAWLIDTVVNSLVTPAMSSSSCSLRHQRRRRIVPHKMFSWRWSFKHS